MLQQPPTRLDVYLESKWEWFKQKEVLQSPGELSSSQPRTPIHFQVICGEVSEANGFYSVCFGFLVAKVRRESRDMSHV